MSSIYIDDPAVRSVYDSDSGKGPRRPAMKPSDKARPLHQLIQDAKSGKKSDKGPGR